MTEAKAQRIKIKKLENILRKLGKVVIAYSGGVDSTYLAKIAVDILGKNNVIAVTAKSETYPKRELSDAKRFIKLIGAKHIIITTKELDIKHFKNNPPNRCYYCKFELFSKLKKIAKKSGIRYVLDATNYDDRLDIRYGRIASKELGIISPLLEAKITKDEIRTESKKLRLPTHDKPPFACLASRFPYNEKITKAALLQVSKGEDFLRDLGIGQVRLRKHGDTARIEVSKKDFKRIFNNLDKVTKLVKSLGFCYITLDLEGYRTGSMNEMLRLDISKSGTIVTSD